jgi:hypothetical protein
MATANQTHAAGHAGAAHTPVTHPAQAHGHAGHDAHGHGHGHGAHVDPAVDKQAAFVGLIGGLVLIGALVYGMVLWTNAQFAGHAASGERPAATSTH